MRFGVLGPIAVWADDGTPVAVPGGGVRALLADLLVHRGTVVTADRLVADLWEHDPPAKPLGALQGKVSQLRRALEAGEPGGRDLVVSRGPGYLLDVPARALDAGQFDELSEHSGSGPAETVERLSAALALWRGAAFADVADAGFARAAADELEQRRLATAEALLERRSRLGEDDDAVIAELATLADRHPLRERLHATLIRALYRAGRQADALGRFDSLRTTLADELGVDPSPELVELHGAILRQEPGLDRERGEPGTGPEPAASNLPAAWDELVGREQEIADLRSVFDDARLVTVVGPGGVGKTRLALEAARALSDDAPDGVWWVDLTGVDDAGGSGDRTAPDADPVAEAVAVTLGLRDDGPSARPESCGARAVETLRDRRLVLLLDNCEHVLDGVAGLVAQLLRHAPRLRVLATSREPLGIRGEHLRPVEPLALPDPDGDPADSAAVRLFTTRAREADPAFALTGDTAPLVAAVCRRLDGLPLALELAAARVRTLGLREVATRLGAQVEAAIGADPEDRFALLDSGPRDAPPRQRTLRAVIDWSWEPLSEVERAVLRRLAVTVEGAGADLVETVCAGDPVPAGEVLPVVARLVDRSLVAVVDSGAGARWRMLETVTAYAGERLAEAGETDAVRLRHAEGCAALLDRAAPGLRGSDQAQWLARLDQDSANVRLALDSAVAAGDGPLALRIAVGASWYLHLRGRRSTARRALSRALDVADGRSLARAQARAAHAAILIRERKVDDPTALSRAALAECDGQAAPAAYAFAQWSHVDAMGRVGDTAVGEDLLGSALAGFRSAGDRWGVAAAQAELGFYHVLAGRLDDARSAATEAGDVFDELGDRWGQAHAAELLGHLDEIAGDYPAATRRHRDGLRHAEQLRLWPSVIAHRNRLGRLALLAGDHDAADDQHGRALALAREHGNAPAATFARLGLGMSARRRGRLDDAEQHLREVMADRGVPGFGPPTAITFAELGFVAEQRGDVDEARRSHRTGLEIARAAGDVRAVALAVEGLAGVAMAGGDHERAAELLGAAAAAREGVGAPLPTAERGDVDRIEAGIALDPDAFAAAHARGRTAGVDETVPRA